MIPGKLWWCEVKSMKSVFLSSCLVYEETSVWTRFEQNLVLFFLGTSFEGKLILVK